MPIAIYRHKKLFIAHPKINQYKVAQLKPEQIREMCVRFDRQDNRQMVSVRFVSIKRKRGLCYNEDQVWELKYNRIKRYRSNWLGCRTTTYLDEIPPLATMVWCDSGDISPIMAKIEQGIATRPIIERYLLEHVIHPERYSVWEYDLTQPQLMSIAHIDRSEVEIAHAEQHDQSASADKWLQLLLKEEV